jgi:hypothetical protein
MNLYAKLRAQLKTPFLFAYTTTIGEQNKGYLEAKFIVAIEDR